MKSLSKWFGAAAAVVLLGGTAMAGDVVYVGKVKSIDSTKKEVVLTADGKDSTFKLGDNVVINRGGKDGNDLKPDDAVSVLFDKGPLTWTARYFLVKEGDYANCGLERGAFAFMTKTVTTDSLEEAFDRLKSFTNSRPRRLLVVEDDPAEQLSVSELLGHSDVEITNAVTGADALEKLRADAFDCVVLDLKLPDMSGFELLAEVQKEPKLRETPIIVFTGRELSESEESELRKKAKSIVLKGVRSPERLLDETALFLHRVMADLPPSKRLMIEHLHESDEPLHGRKVLVVDDDIRNIFALNSLLERHNMQVITATNGQEAINLVESTEDLSLVLMDVMMPEMDGYETMRRIRSKQQFRMLPIIALTAKAMKGDREKCLEAGASDYVAKPVNTDQLLSLVRMWLHR